ncbi:NAD(P)-dependent oxidoreductase [Rhodococcus sp. ARC_M6]|uniref:NAD(P)-dependent oxidoreductase n=1 Tax=Rhodococcus sp. ARC_M6 TaxID=2928852 RepID=UPI001FB34FB3|nr:NAD(P)-dependent oxidoreductase [Rhodococcus sp. ARC_M6]MCJ0903087.1 NAD(P)-dependent oxidoreductase [Rhodococcus sp. ARC_M6]
MDIGFLGLGTMGRPIARNLAKAGHQVKAWNRTPGRAASIVECGGTEVFDASEALANDVVMSMLANDQAFENNVLNEQALRALPAGAVYVNLATVSPTLARTAAATLAVHGVQYLSAPVFGRADAADAAALTVLVAGDVEAIAKVDSLLAVIGRRMWNVGDEPAQANVFKILGNYLIANAIQAISEATTLAEKLGGSPEQLMEIMNDSLFPGAVYGGYGSMIAKRDYEPVGFSVELGLKDVRLALAEARDQQVPLAFGSQLENIFVDALAHGQGALDWASVAEATRRRAGVDPK